MKRLTLFLGIAALALAGCSLYLWQALRAEHQLNEVLTARVAAEAPPARAFTELNEPRSEIAPSSTVSLTPEILPQGEPPAKDDADRLDPEMLAMERARKRVEIREAYSDMRTAMGLTPAQYEQLLDIVSEYSPIMLSKAADYTPDARNAAITAALGDETLQALRQYEQSLGAREQVRQLRSALESSKSPLPADQFETLVGVVAQATQRASQEAEAESAVIPSADKVKLAEESFAAVYRRQLEHVERRNRYIIDAAQPYLSASQVAVLQENLDVDVTNIKRNLQGSED